MMEFDEQVQKVQRAFTVERIKRFAIASPELLKQSDYVRSLYIRMLCALMRCGSPTEEQVLFVQRLAAGAEVSDDFTELMRQSMNMDAESITAFLEALSPNDMKYYFVLDGCITCVLGTGNDRFAMLAECAELLGVTEIELRYLVKVVKAIVLQSSAAFDEAKKYQTARTENLSLFYYLKAFYTGAIINNSQKIHIIAANQSEIDLTKYTFEAPKIIIENAVICLSDNILLPDCDSIQFINCRFYGDRFHLTCEYANELIIEKCLIEDCKNGFLITRNINRIAIIESKILNCEGESIFLPTSMNNIYVETFQMKKCTVHNVINNSHNYYSFDKGVIATRMQCMQLLAEDNCFSGCRECNVSSQDCSFFGDAAVCEAKNNHITGEVTKMTKYE